MDQLNRRTAILAIGGATALVGAPLAMAAKVQAVADRSAWDRALASVVDTRSACAAHEKVWAEAWERCEALRPSLDMIKHDTLFLPRTREEVAHSFDVESAWTKVVEGESKWWWSKDPDKFKADRRAALDSVLEYRRLKAEAEEVSGYNAASDKSDELSDAAVSAWSDLIRMPAPDTEALLWKIETLFGPDGRDGEGFGDAWSGEVLDAVMLDARRLLSARRA